MSGDGWDDTDDEPEFESSASDLDALPDYAAVDDSEEVEDDGFGAPAEQQPDEDDEQIPVVQTVNPPGTVTITAYLDGSIARVDLDPKVTDLTETQLAEEIRYVAGVASIRATAVVHVSIVKMLMERGIDMNEAHDYVARNMSFATPEQAAEAELALIARHADRPE